MTLAEKMSDFLPLDGVALPQLSTTWLGESVEIPNVSPGHTDVSPNSVDTCTGHLTPLGTAGATVLRGWTRVIGDSYPRVPTRHISLLVAITNGQARAASAPVALAAPPGCAS